MRSRAQELLLAVVFLTRLPLGRFLPARVMPLAQAAWAFPLVGALIGTLAGLPLWLPGPGLLPAALAVALAVWLTGALHEDALADFADAGGGHTREDRLRIMRDSSIGSYGATALIACLVLRVAALAALGPLALIAAAAAGRAATVGLMAGLPAARAEGLGRAAGRPGRGAVAVAWMLTLAILWLALPVAQALLALLAAAAAGLAVAIRARRLLGGQTGDVLGAGAVLAETAVLVTLAAMV